MFYTVIRIVLLVLFISIISACTNSGLFREPVPASGRYAAAWQAYIGAKEGETIYPQFAFIDIDSRPKQLPDPEFAVMKLITDKGAIDVTDPVVNLSPDEDGDNYRLFTLRGEISELMPGTYRAQQIEYVDETGTQHTLDIGHWMIEVVETTSSDKLKVVESTVGATSFAYLEGTLQNTSSDVVDIQEFYYNLPDVQTSMTLEVEAGQEDIARVNEEVQPQRPTYETVQTVQLDPGQTKTVVARVTPDGISEQEPFILIKPFLEYRLSEERSEVFRASFPQQIYAPFLTEEEVLSYVDNLPSSSYHPFP